MANQQEPQTPARVPNVTFKMRVKAGNEFDWKDMTSDELFKGKKVVVFSLPGAFTPTCSSTHLPGYEEKYDELRALGIDEVYCISVNDAFVMNAWGKAQGAEHVQLLPDGSCEFTKGMGMLVEKDNLGFGLRSWRYSMFVDDGEIKKVFIEPGFADNCPADPFEVSDVETMLGYLRSTQVS